MNRLGSHVCAIGSLCLGLLISGRASAASLTQVNRSDWTGGINLPSYVQMYIYVPDKLATKPPIMVSSHSCGSTASGQMGNISKIKAAADQNGFILILPDNPGQNCWDVGTKASLTHDGGGDTHAVAQMVRYALKKYSGDAARVYAMGGSSGAMMTQALMAVYPDIFRAGSARAGVPAGCWSDGYDSGMQWSNNCAGGNTTKTAMAWGDLARGMDANYMGHRPRLQIMQGESDTTISYKNTAESIKQWTNVLGLSTDPSSSDKSYKAANATYDRQFWKNACGYVVFEAWSSPGGTHSMPYEEADILKYFGLDTAGGTDPEPDCNGMTGTGGAGGASGTSGGGGMTSAAGGVGQGGASGATGMTASGGTTNMGAGGASNSAGGTIASSGGTTASSAQGGTSTSGGVTATGSGGTSTTASGASSGNGTLANAGKGNGGSQGTPQAGGGNDDSEKSGGCAIRVGYAKSRQPYYASLALALALFGLRRRQRRSKH